MSITPYGYTVYIDSDIIIKMPIDEMFEMIDTYDIVASKKEVERKSTD